MDLDLARLAEAHVDAVAIVAELRGEVEAKGLWGVWAANPPTPTLTARRSADGWCLDGIKPWCSGAGCCDYALVTAEALDGYRLFAVELADPRAIPVDGSWRGLAMRGSDSRSVEFSGVRADPVGPPGAYLDRPGFWHGAVGVAAVWWGGARGVAAALARADARRPLHAHALAHAGAVDAVLSASQAIIAGAAGQFDADPADTTATAQLIAGRVRAVVEAAATEVIDRTGRALGAAPIALDPRHASQVANLTLYLRQSHAERDLEALGRASLDAGGPAWDTSGSTS